MDKLDLLIKRLKEFKEELRKEYFDVDGDLTTNITNKHIPLPYHGWIKPRPDQTKPVHPLTNPITMLKMPAESSHSKWINHNHNMESDDAWKKGWIGLGHAGDWNASAHIDHPMNSPEMDYLRNIARNNNKEIDLHASGDNYELGDSRNKAFIISPKGDIRQYSGEGYQEPSKATQFRGGQD